MTTAAAAAFECYDEKTEKKKSNPRCSGSDMCARRSGYFELWEGGGKRLARCQSPEFPPHVLFRFVIIALQIFPALQVRGGRGGGGA